MNIKKERNLRENGITLIALIITIIILLILVAVSVATITRSNIINYARKGASDYELREGEEEKLLAQLEDELRKNLGESEEDDNDGIEESGVNSIFNYKFTEDDKVEITGFNFENLDYEVLKPGFSVYEESVISLNIETLIIPSKIAGKDVISVSINDCIGHMGIYGESQQITGVKRVIFPKTVKRIGKRMGELLLLCRFRKC